MQFIFLYFFVKKNYKLQFKFSFKIDGKAYAIDADNGQELWSYQMEGTGTAPPIIYNIREKQFVSFVSTGGNFFNYTKNMKKSSNIYTFSIN